MKLSSYIYFLCFAILQYSSCQINDDQVCNVKIDNSSSLTEISSKLKNCSSQKVDSVYLSYFYLTDFMQNKDFNFAHFDQYKKIKQSEGELDKYEAFINLQKGITLNKNAQLDSAEIYINKAIQTFTKYDWEYGLAVAYKLLSINDIYAGRYSTSYDHHLKALKYFTQVNDSSKMFEIKSDISIDFYKLKDYNEAIKNTKEVLEYYNTTIDTFMQAYQESMLSVLYYHTKQFDLSKLYALQSLEKRIKLDSVQYIGESYNNLALPQMANGEWHAAIQSLQKADSIYLNVGDNRQLPLTRYNIAKCKSELGDNSGAQKLIFDNIKKSQTSGQKEAILANLKLLSEIYKKKGDYKNYANCLEESKQLNDELYSLKNAKELSDLKNNYAIQSRQQEIKQLQFEQRISKYFILLFTFIALLIITLLILQIRKNKLKSKYRDIELWSNQRKVELMTENIQEKNEKIEALEKENSNNQ